MPETSPSRSTTDAGRWGPVVGRTVLIAGLVIYVAAFVVVTLGNDGQIRFTADSNATIPVWHPLLPVVIGGLLALLVPPDRGTRSSNVKRAANVRVEAAALLGLAVAFTVLLSVLGPEEPHYILLKSGLLLAAPLALFAITRHLATVKRRPMASPSADHHERIKRPSRRHLWSPALPAAGWTISYLILTANQPVDSPEFDLTTLVAALAIGFVLNALLEEFFYRRWLQTRWTQLLGGVWPAIVLSSIMWATWHIAIQGQGNLAIDLANVIANQGVTGLFLGLLWTRYRAMWPLLVLHGLLNANPLALLHGL